MLSLRMTCTPSSFAGREGGLKILEKYLLRGVGGGGGGVSNFYFGGGGGGICVVGEVTVA